MKETEQTLLDQIKNQVAREIVKKEFTNIHDVLVEEFYRDWSDLLASENVEEYLDEVCERYYQAKAKADIDRKHAVNVELRLKIEELEKAMSAMFTRSQVQASCEATLKNASEKAVVRGYCAGCERVGLLHCAHADSCGNNVVIVDKSSINHPSNIVIV